MRQRTSTLRGETASPEGARSLGANVFSIRALTVPRPTPHLAPIIPIAPTPPAERATPVVPVVELGSEHLVSLPDDTEVRICRLIIEELRQAPGFRNDRSEGAPKVEIAPPKKAKTLKGRVTTVAAIVFALVWNVTIGAYLVYSGNGHRDTKSAPALALASAPVPIAPRGCTVTSPSHVLARSVLVRGGVEAAASDNRIGLGVVKGAREGIAFELDGASLAVKTSTKVISSDTLRRVVPALYADAPLDATGDVGPMHLVSADDGDSYEIGLQKGFLVWRGRDTVDGAPLWPMASDVEAPRVASAGTLRVVVFRQGASIAMGAFEVDHDSVRAGALASISDGALQVGAPSVSAHGDDAIAAWAQRDKGSARWTIRYARAHRGARVGTVHMLPTSSDAAIAPSVAALADGRFLMAWTEGGRAGHRVRAQLVGADDVAVGTPLDLSPFGADAGQAQLALGADGRGTAGYLVARARTFDLVATPIVCE